MSVSIDELDELTNEIQQGFMQRGGWKTCRYAIGQYFGVLRAEIERLKAENKQQELRLDELTDKEKCDATNEAPA